MMAVAADSKSNTSITIVSGGSKQSSSMIRPTLQNKKNSSSRRQSRNAKALKTGNSAQRLSQLKKRLSLGYKRSDSYHKIDPNVESFHQSWNDNSTSNRMDSLSTSNPPFRRGVRRRRSCDDDFHSLYKAAAMAIDQGVENERLYQSEEFHLCKETDRNTNFHSIVPSARTSPTMRHNSVGTLSSFSSRSSDKSSDKSSVKSSSDFLARATAVAGRKQRASRIPPSTQPSPASSNDLSIPISAPLAQKLSRAGYSSYPHLLKNTNSSQEGRQRRQSDPAMDLSGFSNKLLINGVTSTPRTRRRSRRLIPNETVMHHSNDAMNDEELRRDMFRKDFPEEPIPSDAILLRLYGNMTLPPPPPPPKMPFPSGPDEQASASNGSYGSMGTPNGNRSSKQLFRAPVISPQDMPKNAEDMTFTSEPERKAWEDSFEKVGRRGNPNDESRGSESPKSKGSHGSSRRSSSKSKLVDASDRSYSRSSNSRSLSGHRSRGHKTRRGSKSNDLSGETKSSKSKASGHSSHRKNSSHGMDYGSPKNKSRKGAETMKVRNKTAAKKSSPETCQNSDNYEAFQALLDLSNGSFFDSNDDLTELKTSESLAFLRTSLKSVNSAPKMSTSWNDSTHSFGSFEFFAEGDDTADKERKKKRKGKRGEGKIRSRSADDNRNTSTKSSRRGKRSSKTKSSKIDPKSNDDSKTSLHSLWYGESDSHLFDSSLRGDQRTSNAEREPESIAKQHRSPRFVARKSSSNESIQKQQKYSKKSPKLLNKKELTSESPANLSTRKRNKKGTSSETHSSGEVHPSLEQGSTNSKNNDEFPLSSWGDEPTETKAITAEDIIATARDILASPKVLMGNHLTGKSRWDPERSPVLNAMSPRSVDTAVARVPRFDVMPIPDVEEPAPALPPPQSTTPPSSPKKLDFPLNFMEYQNVSPLTVASKKVSLPDIDLMSAIDYLDA